MYIESIPNRNSPPAILLRESRREGKRVIKRTITNLSKWPSEVVAGLKVLLKGGVALEHNDPRVTTTRSLPHGHVAAVLGTLKKTGLDKIIGSRHSRRRNLVLGMIASRIISPASKFATLQAWNDETATSSLGRELDIADASEQEVYEALDWLYSRQSFIEKKLAKKHLQDGCLILCDVSASYYTGTHCNLAKFGHKKDRKMGVTEIVYGLICNARGCPVGIQVFEGNTSDPKVFSEQMVKVKKKFGIERLIMVGDRGLITQARITEDLAPVGGLDWISALRSSAIQKLVTTGAFQLSLFDTQDMAEITSDDFPGERLVVCRNPLLADERTRKRQALLTATEALLQKVVDATQREKRPFKGKDKIALRVGKIINKYKMNKHFILTIEEDSFSFERNHVNIDKEAALDGFYIIRTSVANERMNARQTVQTYKSLSHVEQAFRSIKSVDLKIRPIFHRLDDRVRSHMFLCMLSYYVEWHMRQCLAPLLFDDEEKEKMATTKSSIVAPTERSPSARKKAASKRTEKNLPAQSFQLLLANMATICQNTIQFNLPGTQPFNNITSPTALQKKALDLLGVKV